MSDLDLPAEQRALLRVQQVIGDELARAGLSAPDGFVAGVAQKFVNGVSDRDTQLIMDLVWLGQGEGGADNQGVSRENAKYVRLGRAIDPAQVWESQRENWDGYGWNRQKIEALGRRPQDRELSRGGRAAKGWTANLRLLDGLLKQPEAIDREERPNYAGGPGGSPPPAPSPEQARRSVLGKLVGGHSRLRGQTHGESGWMGSMTNREYPVGAVLDAVQPFSEAAWNWARDLKPNEETLDFQAGWIPQGAKSEKSLVEHYADARIAQDIRAEASRVEPTVPERYQDGRPSVAAGSRELMDRFRNQQPTYDDWYRNKYGQYPGYLHSSLATLANAAADPSVVAFPAAAKITNQIGRSLMAAGKAMRPLAPVVDAAKLRDLYHQAAKLAHPDWGGSHQAMKAVNDARNSPRVLAGLAGESIDRPRSGVSEFLRRWGTNLRQGTRYDARHPFMALLTKELLLDEAPTGGGLQAAIEFGTRTEEPSVFGFTGEGGADKPEHIGQRSMGPVPPLRDWLDGSRRTDQYIPDSQGGWRDRTPEEFADYYQEKYADHLDGSLTMKNQAMLDDIERARASQPAGPPPSQKGLRYR
jgi:hypothetical protein